MDKPQIVKISNSADLRKEVNSINKLLRKKAIELFDKIPSSNKTAKIIFCDGRKRKVVEEVSNFSDLKLKEQKDLVYFRIDYDGYRIDLFYRNFDRTAGNIHVCPGILTTYKESSGPNEHNEPAVFEKIGDTIQLAERGWIPCDYSELDIDFESIFKDKIEVKELESEKFYLPELVTTFSEITNINSKNYVCHNNCTGKIYLNSLHWFNEAKITFKGKFAGTKPGPRASIKVEFHDEDDDVFYEGIVNKPQLENIRKEHPIVSEKYTMTFFYYNLLQNKTDRATLYTFFTKHQKYQAHLGASESLEINTPKWHLQYPTEI